MDDNPTVLRRRAAVISCLSSLFCCCLVSACMFFAIRSYDWCGLFTRTKQFVVNPEAPDYYVAALVIRDDFCVEKYQACHLKVAVSVEAGFFGEGTPARYYNNVYQSGACDATITWLNATEFKIVDDQGGYTRVDIAKLPVPPTLTPTP